MGLPKKERKKLQIQYDIESTENLYGHDTPKEIKWLNRFHIRRGGSFWNWLWMCHFKKSLHPSHAYRHARRS